MLGESQQFATGDPQLISIVRGPVEVNALVSQSVQAADEFISFETKPIPLDRLTKSLYSSKERLQQSWSFLVAVEKPSEVALYHVLVVVIESAPDLLAENPKALLPEWNTAPIVIRATSAHPRAYKGTKNQLPKARTPEPQDLRPYLCDARSMQALLSSLRAFLPGAEALLKKSGYPAAVIARIEADFDPDSSQPRLAKRPWTLPARFVQYIWPHVRWLPSRSLSTFLRLHSQLELDTDEQTLFSVTRFIAVCGAEHAAAWCSLASVLPAQRRLGFLNACLEAGDCSVLPGSKVAEHLEQINLLATDDQFSGWVQRFVALAHQGVSTDYLLAGFRLAAQFNPRYSFGEIGQCADFPEEVVEEIGVVLAEQSLEGWLPMVLWERCGRLPGFAALLRRSQWRNFTAEAASRYLQFLIGILYCDLPETAQLAKWEGIRSQIPHIEALIKSAPKEYQLKAAAFFADWLWSWDQPDLIIQRMPRALALAARLAAPLFAVGDGAASAFARSWKSRTASKRSASWRRRMVASRCLKTRADVTMMPF
jgi:hypothetical protein